MPIVLSEPSIEFPPEKNWLVVNKIRINLVDDTFLESLMFVRQVSPIKAFYIAVLRREKLREIKDTSLHNSEVVTAFQIFQL